MQIEFVLKNTHAKGSEVKSFLEEKTAKLERYFQGRLHARWVISYEREEHTAHLHVTCVDVDYNSEARDHNLLTAIEDAVDKVDRQLQRHKEIMTSHHR